MTGPPSEGAAPQRTPPERRKPTEYDRLRNRHENALSAAASYDSSPHPYDAQLRKRWAEANRAGDELDAHVVALRVRHEEAIEALRVAQNALEFDPYSVRSRAAAIKVSAVLTRHAESAPRATTEEG